MQLNREQLGNGNIPCCQEPDWLGSNPSSAIPSCVSWNKLLNLSSLGFFIWKIMLNIVLLHVVVVRVQFTNLFIMHLEPCLACSKCSVSVMVIRVICGNCTQSGVSERETSKIHLLFWAENGLHRRAWFDTIAAGYWDHKDMEKNQGAICRLGIQYLWKGSS